LPYGWVLPGRKGQKRKEKIDFDKLKCFDKVSLAKSIAIVNFLFLWECKLVRLDSSQNLKALV